MWDSNEDAAVVVVDNNYGCFDYHKEHHCDYPTETHSFVPAARRNRFELTRLSSDG